MDNNENEKNRDGVIIDVTPVTPQSTEPAAASDANAAVPDKEEYSGAQLHEDEAVLNFALEQQLALENAEKAEETDPKNEKNEKAAKSKEEKPSKRNPVKNVVKEDYSDELRAKNFEADKKRTAGIVKFVLALVFLAVVFGVAFNLGRRSVKPGQPVNPTNAAATPTPSMVPPEQREYIIVDLENYVKGLNTEELGEFVPSVEEYYGWQYLCFSEGNLRLLYRNEYPKNWNETKRIVIDNGNFRTEMKCDYDLTGDVRSLLPYIGRFGGDESVQLAFVTYTDEVPTAITFVDSEKLFNYGTIDIEKGINKLYKTKFEEDPSKEEGDKRYKMTFTFSSTEYVYSVSRETFMAGEYDSIDVIDFKDDFELEFKEDGITFAANVRTVMNEYLGRVSGTFAKSNLDFKLSGTRYGSFAIAAEAGFGEDNVITPRKAPFSEFVTIIAKSGQRFYLAILDTITPINIDWANMVVKEDGTYEYVVDGEVKSIRGIDVSAYQGEIDWEKVAAAGVKFAIIRLGYRGYGQGTLEFDKYFEKNIKGAIAAGVKVGIYFFSEALNVEEAVEEAEFVLEAIKDYDVQYPVVFDTEEIANADARANNLPFNTRTEVARAFCDTVKKAGYTPMIYANSRFMLTAVDLEKLNDIDRWFAYYGLTSQFPYSFNIFQYSETGKVDGIPAAVDLDISFVDYSRDKTD